MALPKKEVSEMVKDWREGITLPINDVPINSKNLPYYSKLYYKGCGGTSG